MPTLGWMMALGIGGGAIGSIVGSAGSESQTATGTFRDMLFGGLVGASAGFGIGALGIAAKHGAKYGAGRAWRGASGVVRSGVATGRAAGSHLADVYKSEGLGAAAKEAFRPIRASLTRPPKHPRLEGLVFGAVTLAVGAGVTQSLAPDAFQSGSRNDPALMASTHGLVQGLHRNRH